MNITKKKDHYYLIDGSGYIFRAYYALPPLTRKSDGLPTGAVSGFCNMLFKLLQDATSEENKSKPTHFAVIFDSARKNFRNQIIRCIGSVCFIVWINLISKIFSCRVKNYCKVSWFTFILL